MESNDYQKGRKNFKRLVDSHEAVWLAAVQNVTCEFSTTLEHIDTKYLLNSSNRLSQSNKPARWSFGICETCIGYKPTRPIHIEIISNEQQLWEDIDSINRNIESVT